MKKKNWEIIIFLAPGVIIYSVFMIYPLLNSIYLSFYTGSLFKLEKFVGFSNYIKLFTQYPYDERLIGAFLHNFELFVIACIVGNGLGLLFALLFTKRFKGSEFFRIIFFIPYTLSIISVGFLFKMMLNPSWGIVDKIFEILKLDFLIRPWLGHPPIVIPIMGLILSWQWMGFSLIMFVSGIRGINSEIFEAAKVDGVSPVGLVRHITIPLLKPVIRIVVILTFIVSFSIFEMVYAMASSEGHPNYASDTFATFFYRTMLGGGYTSSVKPDVGLASSIATIMFFIILICVFMWFFIFREKEEE